MSGDGPAEQGSALTGWQRISRLLSYAFARTDASAEVGMLLGCRMSPWRAAAGAGGRGQRQQHSPAELVPVHASFLPPSHL